jgi:outer membrane protein OmpA-like peptidoglycan-associated protein
MANRWSRLGSDASHLSAGHARSGRDRADFSVFRRGRARDHAEAAISQQRCAGTPRASSGSSLEESPMTHTKFGFVRALSGLALVIVCGCHQQATTQTSSPGAPSPPPPEVTREIQLTLGSYLQHCPNTLIRFPFDESQPLPQDLPELKALAACLNSSPYRDVRLRLIGRTDQEGSEEYNAKLGLERAEYVKSALVREGVDAARIDTASAGAEKAGEGAPGYDRRVDVVQLVAIHPI